jgi:CRP/FNR family transcriptional regulator
MKPTNREILQSCSLFRQLDDASAESLLAFAQRRRYPAGKTIFRQGDAPPGLYVVARGLVRIYKLGPGGREHVLHLVGPGGTFAEVAVMGDFPCPADAEAVEETECLMLRAALFRGALRDDHRLCLQLLTGMTFWVRHLVGLLEDITLRDALGRVARYLQDAAVDEVSVELPSLKKHLASHLNLTSETLSRTLRRLSEAGLIENVSSQSLRIVDPEGLREAANGLFPKL